VFGFKVDFKIFQKLNHTPANTGKNSRMRLTSNFFFLALFEGTKLDQVYVDQQMNVHPF